MRKFVLPVSYGNSPAKSRVPLFAPASIKAWTLARVERRRGEVQGRGPVVAFCIELDTNINESPSNGRC